MRPVAVSKWFDPRMKALHCGEALVARRASVRWLSCSGETISERGLPARLRAPILPAAPVTPSARPESDSQSRAATPRPLLPPRRHGPRRPAARASTASVPPQKSTTAATRPDFCGLVDGSVGSCSTVSSSRKSRGSVTPNATATWAPADAPITAMWSGEIRSSSALACRWRTAAFASRVAAYIALPRKRSNSSSHSRSIASNQAHGAVPKSSTSL